MIRVKSTSDEGVYYLANGWKKYRAFWWKNGNDQRCFFKDRRSAQTSLAKLLIIMPDYAEDKIEMEEIM